MIIYLAVVCRVDVMMRRSNYFLMRVISHCRVDRIVSCITPNANYWMHAQI